MTETRLEVRCCCNPDLVYGTLPVVDPYRGKRLEYLVRTDDGAVGKVSLEVERLTTKVSPPDEYGMPRRHLDETQLAIKSNDLPIAIIEQLPGFEPADDDWLERFERGRRFPCPIPEALLRPTGAVPGVAGGDAGTVGLG